METRNAVSDSAFATMLWEVPTARFGQRRYFPGAH